MQGCCELEDVPILPCLHGSVERPLHLGLGVVCIDLHLSSFHGCAEMHHMEERHGNPLPVFSLRGGLGLLRQHRLLVTLPQVWSFSAVREVPEKAALTE